MTIKSTFRGGQDGDALYALASPSFVPATGQVVPEWHRLHTGTLSEASVGQPLRRDDPSKKKTEDIDYRYR